MAKTISFSIIRVGVTFVVSYLLTGDALIGAVIVLIEPTLNTIAYYWHESVWRRIRSYLVQSEVSQR